MSRIIKVTRRITHDEIKEYLDGEIRMHRHDMKRAGSSPLEQWTRACHIDVYQKVRFTLVGSMLPPDDGEPPFMIVIPPSESEIRHAFPG